MLPCPDGNITEVLQVFAVLSTEPAGVNVSTHEPAIFSFRNNELVLTQVRRFIAVQPNKDFCVAV